MKTVEEMKVAKKKLEHDILMEIQEFEADYGVTVAAIHSEQSQEISGRSRTVFISTGIVI